MGPKFESIHPHLDARPYPFGISPVFVTTDRSRNVFGGFRCQPLNRFFGLVAGDFESVEH